jgi:uncharacterized protein (TIGR03086 family)
MTEMLDLAPAASRMAALLDGIPEGGLTAETPCPKYSLGDLVDHVGGLTIAFTAAAEKTALPGEHEPSGDASRLGDDWRRRIDANLTLLADAWRVPDAWTGMTQAGPVEMPGEIAGIVALNELVVHGWDVAKASGQPYAIDDDTLAACQGFYAMFQEGDRGDAFGSVVAVPDDAPLLDRVIGLSGRDPNWSASSEDR